MQHCKNVYFLRVYILINKVIHNFDKNKFNIVFHGMFHNLSTDLSTELSTILGCYNIRLTASLYLLIHKNEQFLQKRKENKEKKEKKKKISP